MRVYNYDLSWWYKSEVMGNNPQGSNQIAAIIEYNRNFYTANGFLPSMLDKSKDESSQLVYDYTHNSYGDCSDELI